MKRVVLLIVTNLAVLATLSVAVYAFGLHQFIDAQGLHFGSLLLFSAVLGFGGAFISLAISKWSARMSVGARTINEPATAEEAWLVRTVAEQAKVAGIGMPEVAIFDSEEVNAFATGMNKNNALVAVSSGLLNRMSKEEAEAVLGHEVSHIANGDMVTLTLIQGVLNTFVIMISRAVGWFVDRVILKNEEGPGVGYFVTFFVLEITLGLLASMVVMWFSRQREFRADAGGAHLAGRAAMIAALERLRSQHDRETLPQQVAAFGIKSVSRSGLMRFFASHPPIEERIAALRARASVSVPA